MSVSSLALVGRALGQATVTPPNSESTKPESPLGAAETSSSDAGTPSAESQPAPGTQETQSPDRGASDLQRAPGTPAEQSSGGANAAERDQLSLVDTYLKARCATALCFDSGTQANWLGIEPLVELPLAKSFAASSGSLSQYVDNHSIALQLAAGIRVWLLRDLVSVSAYLSIPLTDAAVRIEGSAFNYPGSSIRRPYPGIAIGLLYDIIWVAIDHDELRNGDTSNQTAYNPEYPPNARVSSCTTVSVALQPVTALRALFGLANAALANNNQQSGQNGGKR